MNITQQQHCPDGCTNVFNEGISSAAIVLPPYYPYYPHITLNSRAKAIMPCETRMRLGQRWQSLGAAHLQLPAPTQSRNWTKTNRARIWGAGTKPAARGSVPGGNLPFTPSDLHCLARSLLLFERKGWSEPGLQSPV